MLLTLDILFESLLFCLVLMKLVSVSANYIIPFFKTYISEANTEWEKLQEKNSVLVSKKRAMASLFLQQEKQISLLSSKLHTWYSNWDEKQQEKKAQFDAQGEHLCKQIEQQQKNISLQKNAHAVFSDIARDISTEIESGISEQEAYNFFQKALSHIPSERKQEKS